MATVLKAYYHTQDDIPADHRPYYAQREMTLDGERRTVWHLDAEAPPALRSALDKERDANRDYERRLREAETELVRYRDLGSVQELTARRADGTPAAGGAAAPARADLEHQFAERLTALKERHAQEMDAVQAETAELESTVNNLLITTALQQIAPKHGVRPEAIPDLLRLARERLVVVDGTVVPHDEHGDVLYIDDAITPQTPEQWLTTRRNEAPHWFEPSSGGGAPTGVGTGRTAPVRPAAKPGLARMKAARQAQTAGLT